MNNNPLFEWMNKHIIPRKFEKIRIGNKKDGGYVLPKKCVDEGDLCISFGLGDNTTYEKDLLNRNKKVIGYDIALKAQHAWARKMKLDTYQEFSNISEVQQSNKIVLKIDTEGSEFEIIKNFNFNKYDVEIFTIEHNSASYREDIIKLLESKKYYRIPSGHFTPGFEDWYIKKDNPVLKKLGF